MISHLPELTSIVIEENRLAHTDRRKEEEDMIEAFCQVNPQLKSIGMKYFFGDLFEAITWRAASPSIVESSRDAKGRTCIWTPDPLEEMRWVFWLETFGGPSAARRAMVERWPGSRMPSITELVRYTQWQ
jgi:hypothetical protein